ncbi:MAG: hypothetical protein V2J26_08970 [Pacificimonas sp.]|jgi:hypothetical protein|nr:hypothetical protein [Pacificimonas sp.]
MRPKTPLTTITLSLLALGCAPDAEPDMTDGEIQITDEFGNEPAASNSDPADANGAMASADPESGSAEDSDAEDNGSTR